MSFKLKLTCICLSFLYTSAYGHTGPNGENIDPIVDCRKVFNFTFPTVLEFVAKIDCNQFISSSDDWIWRYPNSYFDPPFISAFSPRTRKPEPGLRFFRRLSATEIDSEGAQLAYDNIFKKIRTFPDKGPPKRLIRMDTINDIKDESQAWFGFKSDDKGWVVICAPDCAPEYLFLTEKR